MCKMHKEQSYSEGVYSFPELASIEAVIAMIMRVQVQSRTETAGLGFMAHRYAEADSGRLYPEGISLASVHGLVKEAALIGQWEYDISNCHFAITAQMAQ